MHKIEPALVVVGDICSHSLLGTVVYACYSSDGDTMVKNFMILSILVPITFLALLSNVICSESNVTASSDVFPRITLEIDSNDQVTITVEHILQQRNDTFHRFILLPFTIDEKISHSPSEAFCSWQNYQNQYTIFSTLLPAQTSKLEIKVTSRTLIATNADWRKLLIDLEYENSPSVIAHLISSDETIWQFQTIKIVFPVGIATSEVLEIPPPFKSTDHTHEYELGDISSIGEGRLFVKYSAKGAFWQYEMIMSSIFGVVPAIGILLTSKEKIKPPESKRRHYLFVVIFAITWITTIFSSVLLFRYGPTWDEISIYYPALVLNSLAMINWVRHALSLRVPFLA